MSPCFRFYSKDWEQNFSYADWLWEACTDSEYTTIHNFKVITTLITNANSSFLIHHSPAMDWNGSVLAKLLFCLMDLADEVNEPFAWLWHSLLRPVSELKLPHCAGLTVLQGGSHMPSHKKGRREDLASVQTTRASTLLFPKRKKKGKKKLGTRLNINLVTRVLYLLWTLSPCM